MRAIILAAGSGSRLGERNSGLPKCLLRLGGKTLLQRHLEILHGCGVSEIVLVLGFAREAIETELDGLNSGPRPVTLDNPQYREGSVVSLWTARHQLVRGGDVLVMDADVLYGRSLIERLLGSRFANCFLLDRDFIPGEEPVKLCVRGGQLVEFRKRIPQNLQFDFCGESVGFFRFSESAARQLAQICERYVNAGRTREPHEEAIRDLLLNSEPGTFGFEDITGSPWTEIDFPDDLRRAEEVILPRLS